MRDAIGQTFLYNVVIVMILLLILILIGSFSYSKGFKAKNEIINIIENERDYNDDVMKQIDAALSASGYRLKSSFRNQNCPDLGNDFSLVSPVSARYPYCVYRRDTDRGHYYKIIIYMRFEIPLISSFLEFPVNGDTKTIFEIQ